MYAAGVRTGTFMAAGEIDGRSALPIRPFLRAATRGRYLSAQGSLTGRRYYAPVGCSVQPLRAAYHRPSIQYSAPLNSPRVPRFLRAAASEDTSNMPVDSTPEDVDPKGPPSYWDQIVAFLRGDVFRLILLAVSVFLGYAAAMKGNKFAGDAVDICDKTHKVYNILSKALPIILAFFKGLADLSTLAVTTHNNSNPC